MVRLVTGSSITMPIVRLNFITKLIFIYLTIEAYSIPEKTL